MRVGTSSRDVLGQSSLRGKLYSKKKVWVPRKTDDGGASSSGGGGHGSSVLTLRHTINNSKHSVGHDGLQYVVQARSYTSSPQDLVTTMRGGGVAVWRWGDDAAGGTTVPSLAVRAFRLAASSASFASPVLLKSITGDQAFITNLFTLASRYRSTYCS